jgi:NAD(P)-dependent dehydrogenase (short-subunit alcohol dehydrogenase family)
MSSSVHKYDSAKHLNAMKNLHIVNLFQLSGKVAVVTGGSRGIGMMMAKAFVDNGAKVYIVSRKKDACDTVAKALNALDAPGTAVSFPADVGTDAGCKQLAADIGAREQQVDVLVNNAGLTWGGNFNDFPEHAWGKIFNLNVTALFQLSRAFVPLLKRASKGNTDPSHIINVSSVGGNLDSSSKFDNAPSYGASKAAANKVTQSLAAYLVDDHINVNCIAPAVFESKMTYNYQLKTEEGQELSKKSHPVGRFGSESDMAGLTIFLSTKASAFVTGSIIRLDGGMSAIRHKM